jgi:UDP-glucose:(heptosyl)LPS alpha-1,3-glucosyltransferase
MRVGIVLDELDRRRGGMGEWCWQFVNSVAKRPLDLHVIAQAFGVDPLPSQVTLHPVERTKSREFFARSTSELLKSFNFDVVHDMGVGWDFDMFQPHGGSHAAWMARRLDMYPAWYRAIKRPIDRLMPRRRDFDRHWQTQRAAIAESDSTIIALSNFVADSFERLHGIHHERIQIVYNGVDCRRFSPDHRRELRTVTRDSLGVRDNTLLLLLAAHNFRLKGLPELLRLMARLVANNRRVHLAVAGGRHRAKWRQTTAKLGLAENVTLLGTVGDMVPYYAAADAYVHPTYYDPCSLVLLEAAASGLPVITTRRCNGAAELFRDGSEMLLVDDPAAEDALYERADALFDERFRQQVGVAARKVALRNTIERNVSEIVRLYERRAPRRLVA